jgi:hypothetical protein
VANPAVALQCRPSHPLSRHLRAALQSWVERPQSFPCHSGSSCVSRDSSRFLHQQITFCTEVDCDFKAPTGDVSNPPTARKSKIYCTESLAKTQVSSNYKWTPTSLAEPLRIERTALWSWSQILREGSRWFLAWTIDWLYRPVFFRICPLFMLMIHERNHQLLKTNYWRRIPLHHLRWWKGRQMYQRDSALWITMSASGLKLAVCARIILSVASCSGLPNNNWMFRDYSYFYQVKIQYSIFEPWPAIPWFNHYLFILICKFCNPFPRYMKSIEIRV